MDKTEITLESVVDKIVAEYFRREKALADAQAALDEAKDSFADFKQALKRDTADCFAFGVSISTWKDERHLPNGDSYIIDQGSDQVIEPHSIASDCEILQAEGINASEVIKQARESIEEYQDSQREHNWDEEPSGDNDW